MANPSAVQSLERGEAVEATPALVGGFRVPHETLIALGLAAVAWQLLAFVAPPYVIPGWDKIFEQLLALRVDFVLITVARVFAALVLSFALGLAGAALSYSFPVAERYAMPLVKLLLAVPVVCWILFAVLWFRGLELRIGFVLVITCGPIFWVDLLDGMKGVSKDLRDMLRALRPSRWQFFAKLIWPATVPIVLTSWKINVSLAIRIVTMAELVGATTGIGYGLTIAQNLLSVAEVFAWTIVLVVILYAAQVFISLIEARALRWRE